MTTATVTFGALRDELSRFETHLRSEHKSPRTIESYSESVAQFIGYLEAQGMPTATANVRREHIEAWFIDLFDRGRSPATVALRYRSLRVFFNWLVDDDEIKSSPMDRIKAPTIPLKPIPMIPEADFKAILKQVMGSDFTSRRDRALMLIFYDTGARLSEVANLKRENVDERLQVVHVIGKGGHGRSLPYGDVVAKALTQYLRLRDRHADAKSPWLWLGRRGRLEPRGIVSAIQRHATEAGIGHVHVHQFRHGFAHAWLAQGGQEGDLMALHRLAQSDDVVADALSAADERAVAAHRALSPADRL